MTIPLTLPATPASISESTPLGSALPSAQEIEENTEELSSLPFNLQQQLEQMVQQGDDQHDPVRFQFICSLIKHAEPQRDSVRTLLHEKAQTALDEYRDNCRTQNRGKIASTQAPSATVSALEQLNQYLTNKLAEADSHYTADSLLDFTAQLQQQEQSLLSDSDGKVNTTRYSSKRSRFKSGISQQKLREIKRIDDFIDNAVKQTPETPGPLNPEVLVIRLLKQIHQLSPEYMGRYISYFETLQYLQQLERQKSK